MRRNDRSKLKPQIWLIRLIGVMVPRRLRSEWRQEWEAELRYREAMLAEWELLNWKAKLDLVWRSLGAFWDALWMQSHRWQDEMIQDLRYGVRMLFKNPGFSLVAVMTLALGIGANLTIFCFVDAFFLRPIPAREPEQLVNIEAARNGHWNGYYSYQSYLYFRDHSKSFTALAAHYSTAPLNLVIDGDPRMVNGAVVSGNYFSMLGIEPRLGRFFLPEEDAVPDRNPVAVISYRMWQTRFGGDPAVLGRQLRLNGVDCQIIGVAPAEFPGVLAGSPNEFWLPSMMLRLGYRWCDALSGAECKPLQLLGRLAPGRTRAEAEAELNLLARQLSTIFPTEQGRVMWLRPAVGIRMNERADYAYQMQLLMTVTGLLLAIACANVAGMLLVRAAARRREIAIRLSIGAGRVRLIRQFLTESLMLACAGGAFGLLISRWAKDLLAVFYTTNDGYDLSLSPRAWLYAFGLTLVTGLSFGLLPALQATRQDLARALKDEGGAGGRRRHRLRSALVVTQVSLSLVLWVAASLLVRSESQVRRGANFDPQHVVAVRLRPALLNYSLEKAQVFTREVVRRLESTPGVQSVTLGSGTGLAWLGGGEVRVKLPEQTTQRTEDQLQVEYQKVAPRFYETLKIPLLAGREFNERDAGDAPRVAIINETLQRRLWPEEMPLQRTLLVDDQPCIVVGVSKDARLHNALEAPAPFLYLPYWQNGFSPQTDARMLIRVAGDPRAMLPGLRRVIASVDSRVPLDEGVPLTDQVNAEYQSVIMASAVVSWAGALALFLSMLGLYSVLAFAVGERRREIGIRTALGAQTTDVMKLVVGQGMALAVSGIAVGLLASFALTRLIASLLFGVTATDPITFAVIPLLLAGVALAACWLPARKAARIDPLKALRHE